MPRLNNDKLNQANGMLNAGLSATVVSRHLGCTRKTRAITETIPSHRKRCRPLQQLEDSMVFIHRLSEIGCDKPFNLLACTDRTSVEFSAHFIERQGEIGAAVTCTSDVLIGI